MMFADLPAFEPPALVQEVRKRRSKRSRRGNRAALYTVGAIVLLTGSDGETYRCQITHQDANGVWWCTPL